MPHGSSTRGTVYSRFNAQMSSEQGYSCTGTVIFNPDARKNADEYAVVYSRWSAAPPTLCISQSFLDTPTPKRIQARWAVSDPAGLLEEELVRDELAHPREGSSSLLLLLLLLRAH